MQAELIDIRNHLAQYPPFDEMPEELLDRVVGEIEVVYSKAGSQILELGDPSSWLFYVRSGAVEIYRRTGELYNRIGEGEVFGSSTLSPTPRDRSAPTHTTRYQHATGFILYF